MFYLQAFKSTQTYEQATAAKDHLKDGAVTRVYDRKVSYSVFFCREGHVIDDSFNKNIVHAGHYTLSPEMTGKFPQGGEPNKSKPFQIHANYIGATFKFHIKGKLAVLRSYFRRETQEMEVVKQLAKLLVVYDLKEKEHVERIIPKIKEDIVIYLDEAVKGNTVPVEKLITSLRNQVGLK
jgi:hypothetical protein